MAGHDHHKCHLCGFDWAAERVVADPGLQAIIDGWRAIDGATARCDRDRAAASLALMFDHLGLQHPAVRWWSSPVAMLVAHDVQVLGLASAGAMHGAEVLAVSSELEHWLSHDEGRSVHLGPAVDLRWNAQSPRQAPYDAVQNGSGEAFSDASLLCSWANPLANNRDIEAGIIEVLSRHPEARNIAWFAGRSNATFWPGAVASELLERQIAAALGDSSIDTRHLDTMIRFIQNVHVAILRERECWLCDRPVATDYGVVDVLGTIGCTSATYADGSCILVNDGPAARERDASLCALFSI